MRTNWLAVGICAVLYWLLQAVWFSVFSSQWEAGLRMASEELLAYKSQPNFWPYIVALFSNGVLAFVIAQILEKREGGHLINGLQVGLLTGFVASFATVTTLVFELHSLGFIMISAVIPILGCVLMGVVLGFWKSKTSAA